MALPTNFTPSGSVRVGIRVFDALNTNDDQALNDFWFDFLIPPVAFETELRQFARAIARNLVAGTPGATQFKLYRSFSGTASDADQLST